MRKKIIARPIVQLCFTIVTLSILWSCNSDSGSNSQRIEVIDIEEALKNAGEVKLSDYASEIRYYTLESDTSALLGRITDVSMDENHIFIPSSDFMKTLHVFARDGKFIRNVGSKGRAKGEFMAIRSIIPLEDRNAVMVEGGNKAVIYSLDDGKTWEDIPFDKFLTGQESTSHQFNGRMVTSYSQNIQNIGYDGKGNFYLLTMDKKNGEQWLVMTDSTLEKKWEMELRRPVKKELKMKLPNGALVQFPPEYYSGSLYLNDGECVFYHWLKDTAYIVKENCITPRLAVDYGRFRKIENAGNEDDISAHIKYESKSLIFLSMRIPELFDEYADKNGNGHLIYDKIKNRAILLKPYEDATDESHGNGCGAFYNDLDNGMPFWPLAIQGKSMFSFCDAGKFMELSRKYNSPKMKEIASLINEESNPVLIEVVLK